MQIRLLYLGGSRGQSGCDEQQVELDDNATIADVALWVARAHPGLAPLLPSCRWARNHDFAASADPVAEGDEIALLPPVAGGAPRAWISDQPLQPEVVMKAASAPGHGANVLFVGTVRDNARQRSVQRLTYEAYQPMAGRQLERIAAEVMADHPGSDVAIAHRTGRLEVGDIAVVIATAAPHREAGYEANRDALERLKRDAPIWKRELYSDGEAWVGWGGG